MRVFTLFSRGLVRRSLVVIGVALSGVVNASLQGEVVPHPLFTDHAVLQQGREIPVWGTADSNERVTVELAGRRASTTARDGRWLVRLPALPAGGPFELTISGESNRIVRRDILIGEVWVCSGQSNMERQLGPREGQKPITNWEAEVAAANHPEIRQFLVAQTRSSEPQENVSGAWAVCSPETVADFTAVGYFFARDLLAARRVPIGLIHSSWGGTPAEAWTSADGLRRLPDFAGEVDRLKRWLTDPVAAHREYAADLQRWFEREDRGSRVDANWKAEIPGETSEMALPTTWEESGLPDFDGVVWFWRRFDLPASWMDQDLQLRLSSIDDSDTTWVNGHEIGNGTGWRAARNYDVPASALQPRGNLVAVRVLDTGGGGGIWNPELPLELVAPAAPDDPAVSLAGQWRYAVGTALEGTAPVPLDLSQSPNVPTVLYNGMIAPLQPYAIRGVIWYQGESNVGRERQYRSLFPALIEDWRRAWGEGDFPFLFVQIAPHRDMTPEIREAQLLTSQRTKNTAMVVTTDCGDPEDIHPAHKQPVGARLALAARALAYGESIEYSGPVFERMEVHGAEAVLHFAHTGGGLVARDGDLRGFTVAAAGGKFVPARARIRGETVVVGAPGISAPAAVRYGWANVPEGNLFNREGLPASPFRTDAPE